MSNSVLFFPGSTARVSLQNPWRWNLLAGCWEEQCAAFLGQAQGNFLYVVFVIYFFYPRSPWTEAGGLREQKGYPCTHVSIRPLCKEEVNREYVKLLHFCFTFLKMSVGCVKSLPMCLCLHHDSCPVHCSSHTHISRHCLEGLWLLVQGLCIRLAVLLSYILFSLPHLLYQRCF